MFALAPPFVYNTSIMFSSNFDQTLQLSADVIIFDNIQWRTSIIYKKNH